MSAYRPLVLVNGRTVQLPAADTLDAQLPAVGAAGTYTKVTTDVQGRVSAGAALVSSDLPTVGVAHGGTGTATAFTAGCIVFAGTAGVYSQDSKLFWDAANHRLGIGTSSPLFPLHSANTVDGVQFVVAGITKAVRFGTDTNGSFVHGVDYTGTGSYQHLSLGGLSFSISCSGVEYVTIDSSGRMGLSVPVPGHMLHLGTDDAAKPTTNTWIVTSDARLKENIRPFTDGLAVLQNLRPVQYRLNGKAGLPRDEGIGLLAQDAKPHVPYCCGTSRGKLNPGDFLETDLFTFNSHALTYVLVNAVKELAARVKALEGK